MLALRSSAEFLAYLDESKLRARQGATKSLQEIRRRFSQDEASSESKPTEGSRPEGTSP